MFKYRKFTGKKEVANFVWRDSIPSNPIAGTLYWIDDENGTALYFANYDSKLLRLDYQIISENDLDDSLKNKIDVISESRFTDELKEKINRKIGESDLTQLLSEEINNISIDKENNLMTVKIDGTDYYTTIFSEVGAPFVKLPDDIVITTTNDTCSLLISTNESDDVVTKWCISKEYFTPIQSDYEKWNIGTTITFSGLTSEYETYYYIYAVNVKNGRIYSALYSGFIAFHRQQLAPTFETVGNDYSTSFKIKAKPHSDSSFVIQYSSDGEIWKDSTDLTKDNIKSLLNGDLDDDGYIVFSSNSKKEFTIYAKYYDKMTSEDSEIASKTITVGKPHNYYLSYIGNDVSSLSSISNFDDEWKQLDDTYSRKSFITNEKSQYYPCYAIPSGRSLKAENSMYITLKANKTIGNVQVPNGDGNVYTIYVFTQQSSNVDSLMYITIS